MSSVPPLTQWLHIDWMLVVVGAWLLVGVAGILALHQLAFVSRVLFPIGGLLGWCSSAWRSTPCLARLRLPCCP